jgi:uncharacterized protein
VDGPPDARLARRLRGLPLARAAGRSYPTAVTRRARLLGLAFLDREEAGVGLLIPGCRSVHTFGMRFDLDLAFLGEDGSVVTTRRAVPPRRVVFERGARAVLETPGPG